MFLKPTGDSTTVYELIELLKASSRGCDGNVIYEIHNQTAAKENEPHPEFVNRTKLYYGTFINSSLVDQWASNDISYAVRIDGVWYFASHTGSNTYLGGGPSSTLELRRFCYENKIKIFYIEDTFKDWIAELLCLEKKTDIKNENKIVTIAQSYSEINRIIKHCGDGISKVNITANKFIEPNFRDVFLAAITSHRHRYIAEGEAINKEGRTDLIIYDERIQGSPPYIYEFKIHNDKSDIVKGLNQVTKQYATTGNRYNGLVLLNKKKCKIPLIIKHIQECLLGAKIEIDWIDPPQEHIVNVHHKHHLDNNISCRLTIFIFDIQQFLSS